LDDYFDNKICARAHVFLLRKPAVSDYKAFSGKCLDNFFWLSGVAVGSHCAPSPINQAAAPVLIAVGCDQPQQCFAREAH
jgi:hypothetical protein